MAHAAHRKQSPTRRRVAATVTAGVAAGGLALGLASCGTGGAGTASAPRGTGGAEPPATTTTVPLRPVTASLVTPAGGSGVPAGDPIEVRFSEPLQPGAPRPVLDPPVAGAWSRSGRTLTFTPTGGWVPSTHERVAVPAGVTAVERGHRVTLASAYHASFQVASGSTLRLQELLAELQYLPVSFTPAATASTDAATSAATAASTSPAVTTAPAGGHPQPASTVALSAEASAADAVRTTPEAGTFAWRFAGTPASLVAQWSAGQAGVVTRGAVMAFESQHGLAVDGVAGPQVWTALTQAVAARHIDPRPYTYLEVNEAGTQYLRVWSDGADVLTAKANTGVRGARTQTGTFPVYLRYRHQIMRGTDPNGTKYADPVSWISYFNGSDAVHGFQRASYGFAQSNGCVELPITTAKQLWTSSQGYDDYGTLVHVSSGPLGT